MAVAVHISPTHMSKPAYERLIAELEASGAADPPGRLFSAAYGDDEVRLFELWDSKEHFEVHRDDLFEAIRSVGLEAGSVELHALHSPPPD
jgi:quinol monooxygenase YgiN